VDGDDGMGLVAGNGVDCAAPAEVAIEPMKYARMSGRSSVYSLNNKAALYIK